MREKTCCMFTMPADLSGGFLMQLCSEEIWKGIMAQIETLGIAAKDLPEEALTQIYQVRPWREIHRNIALLG